VFRGDIEGFSAEVLSNKGVIGYEESR